MLYPNKIIQKIILHYKIQLASFVNTLFLIILVSLKVFASVVFPNLGPNEVPMFHNGSLDVANVHSTSARLPTSCQKCFDLQTSLYLSTILGFLYSKFIYVHMWPFYREDPYQGLKRYSWGMFAHYSFLCRGGKAVFFLLPRKLPLGIKVDFVGRALHIPKGKKKTDPWMGIVYLSTFAHFTSLNTPFKTAVPENTRGKKEAKK